jgi:hypothetical protein
MLFYKVNRYILQKGIPDAWVEFIKERSDGKN